MAQEDKKLISEILNGNESAMEILVKRHYEMVHSFIYRNISEYNNSYDLTQEVFIKMMKNLSRYSSREGEFKNWLLKIAVNTCKDYFKSAHYRHGKESQDINGCEIYDKDNVIDILEKKEERVLVKNAINKLPLLQREAVLLKYYNELKIREISEITGENQSTIKSRLFNGIKNLKDILGGDREHVKERILK